MGHRVLWTFRRDPPAESESELIDRARDGDRAAFGELCRRHRKAAQTTAWCLLRSRSEAHDVVSDAFAGVLSAMRNGRGPRDNFRTYLLACVRNGCRVRWPPVVPIHDDAMADEVGFQSLEDPDRYVEANTVARAFASLAPRWQHTLWLSEVEQRPAHEISAHFQLSPNATAALTHRARQAFATAYLAEHVSGAPNEVCASFAPRLAAYVRNQLARAQRLGLERHLVTCSHCARAVDELRDVNASLRSLVPASGALATGGLGTQLSVVGSSIGASLGGASGGLLSGGALLKGLAALIVIAPVLVAGTALKHRDADTGDAVLEVAPAVDAPATGADGRRANRTSPVAVGVWSPSGGLTEAAATTTPAADGSDVDVDVVDAIAAADVAPSGGGGGSNVGAVPIVPIDGEQPSTTPDTLPEVVGAVPEAIDDVVANVIVPIVEEVVGRAFVLLDEVLASAGLPRTDEVVAIAELLDSVEPLLAEHLLMVEGVVAELAGAITVQPQVQEVSVTVGVTVAPVATGGTDAASQPASPAVAIPLSDGALPDDALPDGSLPAITLPVVSIPPIEVPILDLPPVTIPVVSVPPITLPSLAAT